MSENGEGSHSLCPICEKSFGMSEIEKHVNKCIFLNSIDTEDKHKRKRSPSPVLPGSSKLTAQPQRSTHKSPNNFLSPPKKFKSTSKSNPSLVVPSSSSSSSLTTKTPPANGSQSAETSNSLVAKKLDFVVPLPKQLQPKSLDDFIGQNHVLGQNTMLRSLLEKGDIPNMILWGPPGCGKTSLAGVIQGMCKENPQKLRYVSLCAATCGVKEVQNAVTAAKTQLQFGRRTVLFMDEIHRFNKKQQDVFLLHVEKGDIVLVGATTENPSFTINNALLSRCRVIVMQKLESDSLYAILERAAHTLNIYIVEDDESYDSTKNDNSLVVCRDALEWLADVSDGDARIALSNLQLVLQFNENKSKVITVDDIQEKIKMNPHHTVPTLDDNGLIIWDSHAINTYLSARYGKDDSLYPNNLDKRAIIDQRLHFDSGVLSARLSAISSSIIVQGAKAVTKDKADAMTQAYGLLEVLLEVDNKRYVAGNDLSVADFSIVTSISTANVLVPLATNRFPKVFEWFQRMQLLPYYAEGNQEGLNEFASKIKSKLLVR